MFQVLPPGCRRPQAARRPLPYRRWAAICLAALAGCSAALDWRQLKPEGWSLGLSLPCKPASQVRQLPLAGVSVSLRLLACTEQGHTFALASADMGDPARVGPALQSLAQASRVNVQGRLDRDQPAAVAGMTPSPQARQQHLSGRLPDGTPVQLRVVTFAHGARVFQATLIGPRADDALAGPFIAGLQVLP